jgi:hypothetical protein
MLACLSETCNQYGDKTKCHFQNHFEGTSLGLIKKFRFSGTLAHKNIHVPYGYKRTYLYTSKSVNNIFWKIRYEEVCHMSIIISSSILTQTEPLQTLHYTLHTNYDTYSQNITKEQL